MYKQTKITGKLLDSISTGNSDQNHSKMPLLTNQSSCNDRGATMALLNMYTCTLPLRRNSDPCYDMRKPWMHFF